MSWIISRHHHHSCQPFGHRKAHDINGSVDVSIPAASSPVVDGRGQQGDSETQDDTTDFGSSSEEEGSDSDAGIPILGPLKPDADNDSGGPLMLALAKSIEAHGKDDAKGAKKKKSYMKRKYASKTDKLDLAVGGERVPAKKSETHLSLGLLLALNSIGRFGR